MNEWITEIRAIEGTEVWDTFSEYKKACERRGEFKYMKSTHGASVWKEKTPAAMDIHAANHYYLRFLDWAPMTTKDTVNQDTPKNTPIVEYPPETLETCMKRYLAQGWNLQYQHRFRNINTGEIIPAEVLCE